MALVFGKVAQVVQRKVELKQPPKATGELAALNLIHETLQALYLTRVALISQFFIYF